MCELFVTPSSTPKSNCTFQMVTDADQRFIFLETAVAGSHHDMSAYDISDFGQKMEGNYFLLADSGWVVNFCWSRWRGPQIPSQIFKKCPVACHCC